MDLKLAAKISGKPVAFPDTRVYDIDPETVREFDLEGDMVNLPAGDWFLLGDKYVFVPR